MFYFHRFLLKSNEFFCFFRVFKFLFILSIFYFYYICPTFFINIFQISISFLDTSSNFDFYNSYYEFKSMFWQFKRSLHIIFYISLSNDITVTFYKNLLNSSNDNIQLSMLNIIIFMY